MILEACISTKNGLIHAQEFNIPRIELCENLSLDGLTPSLVFQKKANHIFKGEKFIMIRPHANGFNYNKKDVITMTKSIEFAKEILKINGQFVTKIFMGSSFNEIVSKSKKYFRETSVFKPPSSRKDSKETFLISKFLRS